MAIDRFRASQKLFIFGIICLVFCMGFLFYAFYILPFLIWNINYGVPGFITGWIVSYQDKGHSSFMSGLMVESIFLVPGLIAGLVSYFISNYMDSALLEEKTEVSAEELENESIEKRRKRQQEIKESVGLGLKIFLLMIAFVIALLLLQKLI